MKNKMEAEASSFPCEDEQIVASALLLLSTPSISSSTSSYGNNMNLLVASSKSYNSSTSVMTIDEASSSASLKRLRVVGKSPISVASREIKLKVVRKSRSKILRISDCQKASSGKLATVSWGSETKSEASSCLSSTTSTSVSSAQTCKTTAKNKAVGTPHLHRRADSIMNLLAHRDGISEIRIRQFLGDSPDTSKALRMLMKQAAVKRSGAGGRCDPYIYMIA
ncbi:uncharacterized protein LOC108217438 [Daucus carota subsp. sativus]